MENASKALIIAGSIILAVLIIILGMYFYNQASGIDKNGCKNLCDLLYNKKR